MSALSCPKFGVLYQIRKSNGMQSKGEKKRKVSGRGQVVMVGKREMMCLWIEKENISYELSFSSSHWFSAYTGKGPPMTSTVWSYPQLQLICPSQYLSQAGPISSFPELLSLEPKRAWANPIWWHAYTIRCVHLRSIEVMFPTSSVPGCRERMKPASSEKSRWGQSIKHIQGPAIALVFLQFHCLTLPSITLHLIMYRSSTVLWV